MARMSPKCLWGRDWHGCSCPSGASGGHGEGFRNVCVMERFDEMKTCACCGMFDDEDDILVCCQGLDCSLCSAGYKKPGVFYGRCAAALGQSGSSRFQNCPWCPPPATVIGFTGDVVGTDEEKYFISMTQVEEDKDVARIIQREMVDPEENWDSSIMEELREARRRLVVALPVGGSAKKKADTLREMQSTLKAEEKELRKLLN